MPSLVFKPSHSWFKTCLSNNHGYLMSPMLSCHTHMASAYYQVLVLLVLWHWRKIHFYKANMVSVFVFKRFPSCDLPLDDLQVLFPLQYPRQPTTFFLHPDSSHSDLLASRFNTKSSLGYASNIKVTISIYLYKTEGENKPSVLTIFPVGPREPGPKLQSPSGASRCY